MSVQLLLDRLDRVTPRGPNRWMARCPCHDDRTPSLSIRELADGMILLHDFGQHCAALDIVNAVGLETAILFPGGIENKSPHRDRMHGSAWRAAFRSIHKDALLVLVAAENIAAGVSLDDADRQELAAATTRIRDAIEVCV